MGIRAVAAAASTLLTLAIACSSGGDPGPSADEVAATPDSPAESSLLTQGFELIEGPVSPDGMQAIFGTPDLGVGDNRVTFVLTSQTGVVRDPAVSVSSFFLSEPASEGEQRQTALAVFRPWPFGGRGLYTTRLNFDAPGRWRIEVSLLGSPGASPIELAFDVKEAPLAPAVGEPSVKSVSKTVADVASSSELTTGSMYDEELYQLTISEAVESGLPSVVVMASPAFCTNAVCGPQVEVLQQLKESYSGRANFIHVDIYDNPQEIQGDLDRAVISPTVLEWNLPSTEWSFVIDSDGIISARFESFATIDELEAALKQVL